MIFSRAGESLWQEWEGDGYDPSDPDSLVFYTIDHVDMTNDIPLRALASLLQRSGIVDGNIGDAYKALETRTYVHGYAGYLEGDDELLTVCDQEGNTRYDEQASPRLEITWVEVFLND